MIQKLAIITLLVLAVLAYDTPLDDCYNYRLPSDWCSISVEGTNVTVTDCVNDELFTTVADTAQILRYDNHNIYFTYSRGFKGGGFDPRGQTSAAPDLDGDGDIDFDDQFEFLRFVEN